VCGRFAGCRAQKRADRERPAQRPRTQDRAFGTHRESVAAVSGKDPVSGDLLFDFPRRQRRNLREGRDAVVVARAEFEHVERREVLAQRRVVGAHALQKGGAPSFEDAGDEA
jgi:hypothetical protein